MSIYQETAAEKLFRSSEPIVHLHTTPKEDDVYFENDDEKTVAMNYIAIAVMKSRCRMLAMSIMSNHFHFILMGHSHQCDTFWNIFRDLLDVYFQHHGKADVLSGIKAHSTAITSVQQLRTEIAYVIRNSFVVKTDVHVFADEWSSGCLYFNRMLSLEGVPASALKGRALRRFTRSRNPEEIDERIFVKDGRAQMWSFVDYRLTELFYDNARQFIHSVLKNVEAQVETANRLSEKPYLSDDELIPIVYKLCRKEFNAEKVNDLDLESRKKLSVIIHNEYHASNKQIARLAKLAIAEVDALFPLSADGRNSHLA